LALSGAIYAVISHCLCSLTVTGILRLISIIKNSEQAGIQSLGPDYVAIWKIRLISIASTSSLILIACWVLGTYPPYFNTLYYKEAIFRTYYLSLISKVYWIPVIMVTLANAVPKLYTICLTGHLFSSIPEKYAISLGASLLIPFLILLGAAFQFTTRVTRLEYYDPLLIMFGCNFVPVFVIAQNKNMCQMITVGSLEIIYYGYFLCKKQTTIAVTSIYFQNNNVNIELHI
jgi:hypothetical protein